jgi:hypothetical protein
VSKRRPVERDEPPVPRHSKNPSPTKRFKKILKWIAIVTGAAIAILLIADALFVWNNGSRLEKRLSALREAGEPLQIADLARERIPPEQNADTFLHRAANDLEAILKELDAAYPRIGYPTKALTPAEQEKLEKLFAAHPQLMPLLEQAADAPGHDPQLDPSMSRIQFLEACMDLSGQHRPLYRALRARSALLLSKGRPDDAVATQILLLRLTRHWRREPMLIGYLVTAVGEHTALEVINQVLQTGPVSPATRQAIETEVAHHDTMDGYTWALRTERAFSLTTVREYPFTRFWLTRGFANDLMLRLLDLYDRHLDDATQPFVQVAKKRKTNPPVRAGLNPYRALLTVLDPGLFSALEAGNRVRAMSRSLRVLNAIQARVPPGSDQVPQLNDLGLPVEATIDPFNGEPLRVKKDPRGWMVYSVGGNGVDDGGQIGGKTDIGVGPVSPDELPKKP